ncbi:hypothetical protein FOZ63_002862, partial [Perkinsus olseni]
NEGVEDVAICDMLKQGCPIGLFDSIEENNAWPAYKPPPGLRPGEPEELRWAREKLEGEDWASLPIGGASGDMGRQWAELIEKEAQLGRVSEIPFEDAEAFTKVAVIWKKGSRGEVTGVRPIDDFRRSGLNRPIRENLKTTICLPKTQDIQTMLSTAFRGGTGNGLGGSQEAWTLEVDIQSAFRQVPIAMQDRNWLCFFGPPVDDMHQRRRVYRHEVAPFGLVTSPALWCRTAAVAFRVLRRLLAVAETQEGEGPLAISPKFRALLYVDDISMVTCSPRFSLIFMLLVLGLFNMPVALNKVKASRYDGRILGYGVEHGRGKAWLTVPEDKLARVENEVREMVNDPTRKNLRRAMGKLNWLAQVATPVKHSLSVGYELLGVLETKNLRRLNLSEPKRAELLRLVETARSHRRLEIVASGRGVDRYRLHVVCTDASLSGVGGVYVTLPWGTNEQADYLTAGVVPTWFAVNAEEHGSLWTDFKRLRLTAGAVGASTKPEERAGSGNWEFKSGDMVFLEMVAACIGVRLAQVAGSAALTTVYSDNEAVVKILSSQKSRAASLRILMSTVAQSSGGFAAKFIAGERNKVADAISRRPTREIRQSAPKWWMAAETQVVADVVKRLCDECFSVRLPCYSPMAGPERVNLDELAFWAQRQPQSASMEAAA